MNDRSTNAVPRGTYGQRMANKTVSQGVVMPRMVDTIGIEIYTCGQSKLLVNRTPRRLHVCGKNAANHGLSQCIDTPVWLASSALSVSERG